MKTTLKKQTSRERGVLQVEGREQRKKVVRTK